MIARVSDSEVDRVNSFIHDILHNEHDTSSLETDMMQRIDQNGLIASTIDSDRAHLSIPESSEQTLAPMTVSASSLLDVAEDGLAIVDISKLTTAKVLDKRSSSSGVAYKCELEPLWLATDLVERVQMGHVHIRSYENGLIRDGCLKTLRVRKRKLSQI
jgi:hypothetical protein